MHFKRVEPAQAVEWIRGAVQLLAANPAPFLLMGLTLTLIAAFPLLGALILLVLSPVFYGGIVAAARAQDSGGQADFNQLMEGFRQPGRSAPLMALCLPTVGVVVLGTVSAVLVMLAFGPVAELLQAGAPPTASELDPVKVFGPTGIVVLALVLLLLAIAAEALLFFALPRVMLDGVEPFSAMRESAQAVAANLGAFLVTVITLFLVRGLGMLVLGLLPFGIGVLIVGSVFTPLIICVLYRAWKDVFAAARSDSGAPPIPPPVIEV